MSQKVYKIRNRSTGLFADPPSHWARMPLNLAGVWSTEGRIWRNRRSLCNSKAYSRSIGLTDVEVVEYELVETANFPAGNKPFGI